MSRLIAAITHYFPAGEYWVGDPCYAVADRDWLPLLERTDYLRDNDGIFQYKGKQCWAMGTEYGDGCYLDQDEREYGVDSGMIGILPASVVREGNALHGGQFLTWEKQFRVYEYEGTFHFGDVEIETG